MRDPVQRFDEAVRNQELLILLRAEDNTDHYDKRLKIKEELQARYPNAEILMTTDLEFTERVSSIPGYEHMDFDQREEVHLFLANLMVVLDRCGGVREGLDHLSGSRWKENLLILTDGDYAERSVYGKEFTRNDLQQFYTSADYEACHLAGWVERRILQDAMRRFSHRPSRI